MPNPNKFLELQHVESAIVGMTSIPDFGYEQDNIILDRGPDAPRNWKLLTDFVWNKDKYQWLQNHLVLRKLRQKVEQQEEQKKFSYHKKTNPDGHKKDQNHKLKKNHVHQLRNYRIQLLGDHLLHYLHIQVCCLDLKKKPHLFR